MSSFVLKLFLLGAMRIIISDVIRFDLSFVFDKEK